MYPKTINHLGLRLPAALFMPATNQASESAPAACFSAEMAVSGKAPWCQAVTPSATPLPKTLIISVEFLDALDKANPNLEPSLVIHWLQALGFELYFATKNATGMVKANDGYQLQQQIEQFFTEGLRSFDASQDYQRLAAQEVARDTVCVLDTALTTQLASGACKMATLETSIHRHAVAEEAIISHAQAASKEGQRNYLAFLIRLENFNYSELWQQAALTETLQSTDNTRLDNYSIELILRTLGSSHLQQWFLDRLLAENSLKNLSPEQLSAIFRGLSNAELQQIALDKLLNTQMKLPLANQPSELIRLLKALNSESLQQQFIKKVLAPAPAGTGQNRLSTLSLDDHIALLGVLKTQRLQQQVLKSAAFADLSDLNNRQLIKALGALKPGALQQRIIGELDAREWPTNINELTAAIQTLTTAQWHDWVLARPTTQSILENESTPEFDLTLLVERIVSEKGLVWLLAKPKVKKAIEHSIKQNLSHIVSDLRTEQLQRVFITQMDKWLKGFIGTDNTLYLRYIFQALKTATAQRWFLEQYPAICTGNDYELADLLKDAKSSDVQQQLLSTVGFSASLKYSDSRQLARIYPDLTRPDVKSEFLKCIAPKKVALNIDELPLALQRYALAECPSPPKLTAERLKCMSLDYYSEKTKPDTLIKLSVYATNSDNFTTLIKALEAGKFSRLRFVDVLGGNKESISQLLRALESHCKDTMVQVRFPAAQQALAASFNTSLGHCFLELPRYYLAETVKHTAPHSGSYLSTQGNGVNGSADDSRLATQTVSTTLHIADNGLATQLDPNVDDNTSFRMVQAGRVLNHCGQPPQRLRTGVILIPGLAQGDLTQQYYQPQDDALTPQPSIAVLDEAYIKDLENKELEKLPIKGSEKYPEYYKRTMNEDARYYELTMSVEPGLTRLLSVDSYEKLIGTKGRPAPGTEFFKGDDGFFYVRSTETQTLSYVVLAHTEQAIKKPTRRWLKGYQLTNYANSNEPLPTPDDKHMENKFIYWVEDIFHSKSGPCRHRVAAAFHHLTSKRYIKSEDIRMVVIDNNHMRLEVRLKDRWHILDLGGVSAELSYAPAAEIYKASPTTAQQMTPCPPSPIATDSQSPIATDTDTDIDADLHQAVTDILLKATTPSTLDSIEALDAALACARNQNVALVHPDPEQVTQQLLADVKEKNRLVHVIDGPEAFISPRAQLYIDEQGKVSLNDSSSAFSQFLAAARLHKDPVTRPQLIIHWDKFTTSERVALNTLLDIDRRAHGEHLPHNIQIVGLCKNAPTDASFFSRHSLISHVNYALPDMTEASLPSVDDATQNSPFEVDVCGKENWLSVLWGEIVLIDNQPVWQQSELAKALCQQSEGDLPLSITLKNLPNAKAQRDCETYMARAKARGEFNYHGYKLPLSALHAYTIAEDDFDFSVFKDVVNVALAENITAESASSDAVLINSQWFDRLLRVSRIEDGVYSQLPGLLEQAAKSELTLFITSELSPAQWYNLFSEAKNHQVRLSLQLAPGISLPDGVPTVPALKETAAEQDIPPNPLVQVTSAPVSLIDVPEEALVIDVEDYGFSGLMGAPIFELADNQFKQFTMSDNAFIKALKDSRQKIVLRGKFSKEQLESLHPLLSRRPIHLASGEAFICQAQLQVIVEVPPHELKAGQASLAYLGQKVEVLTADKKPPSPSPPTYTEAAFGLQSDISEALEDSAKKATNFMAQRRQAVKEALEAAPIIALKGPTGVGKSALISQVATIDESPHRFYHGMDNISAWAADSADNKAKVLFLDEANITDSHLTFLSPLKPGGSQRLLYAGQIYPLDDQHKVIVASNPRDYGGGRHQQRLFADNSIPELHFEDFPPAVLYEVMLKPLLLEANFFQGLSDKDKKSTTEDYLKHCQTLISNHYQLRNAASSDKEKQTVRELQQQAQLWLLPKQLKTTPQQASLIAKHSPLFAQPKKEVSTSGYVPLASNKANRQALDEFIAIHNCQRKGELSGAGRGLNGVFLSGKAGMGKSAMLAHMLAKHRYVERDQGTKGEQAVPQAPAKRWYYKLDADMLFATKKKLIIDAFESGQAIWLDELNSRSDGDVESLLNSVLTGVHPGTGKPAKTKGFMAFFTGNSIAEEGRLRLSPALHHRCLQLESGDVSAQEVVDLLPGKPLTPEISEAVAAVMRDHPQVNIRTALACRGDLVALDALQEQHWHIKARQG